MTFYAARTTELCNQCTKSISPNGDDKVFIGGFCESCFDQLTTNQVQAVIDDTYEADMSNLRGQGETRTREYLMDSKRLRRGREWA